MTVSSRESKLGSHESAVESRGPSDDRSTSDSGLSSTDHRLPTAAHASRVVVEHVRPEIDGGRFPIKRTIGDRVQVTADIFADGHDVVAAVLRDGRAPGFVNRDSGLGDSRTPNPESRVPSEDACWRETPMLLVAPGSDDWTASFDTAHTGWHEYEIVAWVDRFQTWRRDVKAKAAADQDVSLELLERADRKSVV